MSRKVERNEDREKHDSLARFNRLHHRLLRFCVIDNGRLRSHIYTQTVGGAKMTSHRRGCVGNQVQSDYILEHYA